MKTFIWVQVGDASERESFDSLAEAIGYLNELGVGPVVRWCKYGIDTRVYHGSDFVSLYRGNTNADIVSALLPDERVFVEDQLARGQCDKLLSVTK